MQTQPNRTEPNRQSVLLNWNEQAILYFFPSCSSSSFFSFLLHTFEYCKFLLLLMFFLPLCSFTYGHSMHERYVNVVEINYIVNNNRWTKSVNVSENESDGSKQLQITLRIPVFKQHLLESPIAVALLWMNRKKIETNKQEYTNILHLLNCSRCYANETEGIIFVAAGIEITANACAGMSFLTWLSQIVPSFYVVCVFEFFFFSFFSILLILHSSSWLRVHSNYSY